MRIDELLLRSFGPFTDLTLAFPLREADFHVLFGRNEAGKSSALRALKSLLFGVPRQSTDNFIHESVKLRVGGYLSNSDGSNIFLLRRKGTKNTLLDLNEKPLDESVLQRFLSGVSEEMFDTFFGISHDTLASGGQSILNEGGNVGQSLFSAGIGGVDLKSVLHDLNSEADAIFRPKGQNQTLNRAINEYADIKKSFQEASLPGRRWSEQNEELKKALQAREEITKRIEEAGREKNRLGRLQTALPDVALRAKRVAELISLGEVVMVDDNFGTKRREYIEKLRLAKEAQERSSNSIERLKEDTVQIVIPDGIIEQALKISDLHQRLGSIRKGHQDMGRLNGNIQQLDQDIETLFSEIGTKIKDRPKTALRARVHELGGQRQAMLDALTRSDRDIRKTENDLARAVEELQSLSAPQSIHALKSAVLRAQKRGDMTAALEEASRNLRIGEEQLGRDFNRLPLWAGTVEGLENIAVPGPETIDLFESGLQDVAAKIKTLDEKEEKVRADLDKTVLAMETLRMAGAVPTEYDLLHSREKRELGWGLVLRSWIGKEEIDEEAASFDTEEALPKAYEKAVTHADEVADRLRREADRVAKYAALAAQQSAIKESLSDMEKTREELSGRLSKLEHEWLVQWEPAGIVPLSPKEMRAWAARQVAILQKADKARELRRVCEDIAAHIEEHRAALSACLCDLDREPAADIAFDALLTECQSVIDSVETVNNRRKSLEERIQKLEDDLKSHRHSRERLEQNYGAWRSSWKASVFQLGLEPETSPPEAYAVLSKLDELFKKIDEKTSIEKRISGINRDAAEFEEEVKSLVDRIAPEITGLPVDQAVVQMNTSLGRAKTDSARLSDMTNRLREEGENLNNAEETIRIAIRQLEGLCAQTGCPHYEGLEEIENRSSQKRLLLKEIDAAETRLLKIGGGMTISELTEEVRGVDADSLPGTIAETDIHLAELETMRSELDQRLGGIRAVLKQMDGSAGAAEKAQQAQQVLSSIREQVERYVRLRMCFAILSREIERYRNENQDPLLERAGRIFADLTLQSFIKLETDYNEKDEPVITGVRATGEKVGVQGMSDGTRDQLYLALRIASLEKYLAANEPVPFVVDDILIRFDDDRAAAALQILSELSKKTQVLFLTHHSRLVDLVQKGNFCGTPEIHYLT